MRTVVTYKKEEAWLYEKVKHSSCKAGGVKDILIAYFTGKLVYADDIKQVNQINQSNSKCINTSNMNMTQIDLSELGNIFDK